MQTSDSSSYENPQAFKYAHFVTFGGWYSMKKVDDTEAIRNLNIRMSTVYLEKSMNVLKFLKIKVQQTTTTMKVRNE